jgi:7-carboxy-7-deazaguanine synthase
MQKYFVNEIFFSVNGEGLQSGRPMIFIRLAGCNLRCNWCDTPGALEQKDQWELPAILSEVENHRAEWVCITGGEPLVQDIVPLVEALPHKISLETNGTLYHEVLSTIDFVSVDIKPPSSGMCIDLAVLQRILDSVTDGELKAVISDRNDYQFVKNALNELELAFPLVLQPNYFSLSYSELVSLYRADPIDYDIRILLQIHKAGGIP